MSRDAALVVVIVCVLGCGQVARKSADVEVYEAILRPRLPVLVCEDLRLPALYAVRAYEYPKEAASNKVSGRRDLSREVVRKLPEFLPELERSTLKSFVHANRDPASVPAEVGQLAGVSVAENECRANDSRREVGTIVELSGVGLSDAGDQALVYIGELGPFQGRGWYLLLERVGDGWREVSRVQAWVG